MEPIANQALLPLLSEDVRNTVINAGVTKRFQTEQVIHQRGDGMPGLSIILAGRVRFGIYTQRGAYIQTGVLGAGHCFGEATLFAKTPRAYDADALGETEICDISQARFEALVEQSPEISKALLVTLTTRLYEALEFADDLRALSAEDRIVKLLSRLSASGGFDDGVLPVRQTDIAYALGLSRVHVGAALKKLQERGVLKLGYREIVLRARDANIRL